MSSNDIKITVDSVIKNGKTGAITMTGWTLNQKLKQSPEIIVDDQYQNDVSIQRLYRMDVNTLFEVPNEENCGFEIKVAGKIKGTLPINFLSGQAKKTYSLKMNKMYKLEIGTETPTQLKVAKVKKGLNYLRKNGIKSTLQRYQLEKRIGGDEYRAWILKNETDDFSAFESRVNELKQKPLISVIMPVYNVEVRWLSEAIDSLFKQVYPNWELCICDDASTSSELKEFLAKIAKNDERIKVVYSTENGHISKASNVALALATGNFVALMDNDDVLSPLALFRVAEALNKNPDLKLIYSDEDKIDENGKRFEPAF
ncbi:MAG: glycosyltransferase, partial [Enterococcus sp.]|nr:glycosyltransferase [Enterococcus sp.]